MTTTLIDTRVSSFIDTYTYDAHYEQLSVSFKSGVTYVYFDVTFEEYAKFTTAPSPGSYLNLNIKPAHHYEKVEQEVP